MNSIKAWREGKNLIRFKDGTTMTYTCPEMRINGAVMGDRVVNYAGNYIIKDFKNKIECQVLFPYKDTGNIESIKNSITKLFSSKEEDVPLDHYIIQIYQVNKTTKQKELVSEGHGSWLGQCYIDGKK
jgi:hypothetical protein